MAKLEHPSKTDPHYAWFHCPGCDGKHAVGTGPGGWGWNGSHDAPTLTPSVKVTGGGDPHYCCHSFVREGRIEFLGDCTHALAGQTVDLPDLQPEPPC
ncbi:ammonia monooxygenase [Variovorax paradoxus]|nr:ammonia monooxygenase [Variovorax paradoxus]